MGSIKRCIVSVIVCNSQSPSSISNFTERQRTSTVQKRNVWLLSYIDLHAAAKLHTPEEVQGGWDMPVQGGWGMLVQGVCWD